MLRNLSTLRVASHRPLLRDVTLHDRPTAAAATLPLTVAHLPDLRGHFPAKPVVPAVFILDAMFQLAAQLHAQQFDEDFPFDLIREAKFRKVLTPAHRSLRLEVRPVDHDTFKALAFLSEPSRPPLLAAEAEFGTYPKGFSIYRRADIS